MSRRIIALVEGKTEQTFVRDVLAEQLGEKGIDIKASWVGKPGHKGGVGEYHRAKMDIIVFLKQDRDIICTTMFDYYGMPGSWPGRLQAKTENIPYEQKAHLIEDGLSKDIAEEMGQSFNPARFIPYIQMHEFEAILFSDVDILAEVLVTAKEPDMATVESGLRDIVEQFPNPEQINDDPASAPSKRIQAIAPHYRKVLDGNFAAQKIGLELMQRKCPLFRRWLGRLEKSV